MDDFYMVLPSNSSMDIYPENTTTRFTTHLPQQVHLQGTWRVALTEVQIPLTLQHVGRDLSEREIRFFPADPNVETSYTIKYNDTRNVVAHLPCGVYNSLESLINEFNKLDDVLSQHLKFYINSGGYASIKKICDCNLTHFIIISKKLKKILGFDNLENETAIGVEDVYNAVYPANLMNALPTYIMIYTNILEHQVTGNVQTPLLRSLTLDLERYTYGGFAVKHFSQPMYLPILVSSFRNIEIDIRDQFGQFIPFDYGTLTVTLHFKHVY